MSNPIVKAYLCKARTTYIERRVVDARRTETLKTIDVALTVATDESKDVLKENDQILSVDPVPDAVPPYKCILLSDGQYLIITRVKQPKLQEIKDEELRKLGYDLSELAGTWRW